MWDALFSFTNIVALAGWVALIALPRWKTLLMLVLYLGVGLLCAVYAVLLVALLAGWVDPEPVAGGGRLTEYSVDGLMELFRSRGGIVVAWTHYLAFDLFAGLWIARDADHKGFSRWVQAPILLPTFLAGPLGLLMWLIVRERRARRLERNQPAGTSR